MPHVPAPSPVMRLLLTSLAALTVAALTVAALAAPTLATPPGLTVDRHGQVILSTLPSCTVEDGSSGPLPCTWNVGPDQTGNGRGLSYFLNQRGHVTYVWDRSPVDGTPWRWLTRAESSATGLPVRCVTRPSSAVRCPDGTRTSLHTP